MDSWTDRHLTTVASYPPLTSHSRWTTWTYRRIAPFRLVLLLVLAGPLLTGCDLLGGSSKPARTVDFDFSQGTHQWEAFFTDYPVGKAEDMELRSGHRSLPSSIDASGKGLYIHGFNESDNVKMLFRRRVTGLEPNTPYSVRVRVQFATSVPSNCTGIGGAPGEAVKVIAAASRTKPAPVVIDDPEPYYHLNVHEQAADARDWYERAILGHIANSRECDEKDVYELKTLESGRVHDTVTTDEDGAAWLLFGTRSGFEGPTSLYYTHFRVELRR